MKDIPRKPACFFAITVPSPATGRTPIHPHVINHHEDDAHLAKMCCQDYDRLATYPTLAGALCRPVKLAMGICAVTARHIIKVDKYFIVMEVLRPLSKGGPGLSRHIASPNHCITITTSPSDIYAIDKADPCNVSTFDLQRHCHRYPFSRFFFCSCVITVSLSSVRIRQREFTSFLWIPRAAYVCSWRLAERHLVVSWFTDETSSSECMETSIIQIQYVTWPLIGFCSAYYRQGVQLIEIGILGVGQIHDRISRG